MEKISFFKPELLPEPACCGCGCKLGTLLSLRVSFGASAESVYLTSAFHTLCLLHFYVARQALQKEVDPHMLQ